MNTSISEFNRLGQQLQVSSGSWAEENFKKSTPKSVLNHLKEEVGEFIDSCEQEGGDPFEAADCILLLCHYAYKKNFELFIDYEVLKSHIISNSKYVPIKQTDKFICVTLEHMLDYVVDGDPLYATPAVRNIVDVLFAHSVIHHYDLMDVCYQKLEINKNRTWEKEPNADGYFKHV